MSDQKQIKTENHESTQKREYTMVDLIKRIEDLEKAEADKRIKTLETDLKTLKKVHNLPTSFGGKRVLYKAFNGNYRLEGGGIGRPPSPDSDDY